METLSVRFNHCGAPLQVSGSTRLFTCLRPGLNEATSGSTSQEGREALERELHALRQN